MKNFDFQESPENFGRDLSDDTDVGLVNFLKQNKLIAPPPAENFEKQLFAEISKHPHKSAQKSLKRWLPWLMIPAAIATYLTFNWVTNRGQLQIADRANYSQMSDSEKIEIEKSLVSSWSITDDAVYQTTNSANSADNQFLIDLAPIEYE